jgi:lipopolysaccharide export system protein LptC
LNQPAMRKRRTAHRNRLLLLIGGGGALVLGSFWLLQLMHGAVTDAKPAARGSEPDYYVENFTFVRMSKTGQARYNVAGKRLIHRPDNDTYEITLPVVHSFSEQQPPLMMRAEQAIAVPDSSIIHMREKVEVDRPASATANHFHLKSDYLEILPDEDIIKTDRPVDMILGASHLTGIGMYVNNATREFRLAQQVHGVFPPHAGTAPGAGTGNGTAAAATAPAAGTAH